MPAKALKSMAKKAGKSFKKAKEYWNEAEKSFKEAGKKVEDKYAYIMGIVKSRLGLADSDLLLNVGIDQDLLLDSVLAEVDTKRSRLAEDEDKYLIAVYIKEMIKADNEEDSDLIEVDEDGEFVLSEEYTNLLTEKQSEGQATDYWRKILLNCPELFVRYIAQVTSD